MGDNEMTEYHTTTCTLCNSPNVVYTNDTGSLCEIHYNMSIESSPKNKMIYIAGPIANGKTANPRDTYINVMNGIKLYMQLVEKGYSPICPHFSYFAWINHDKDIDWHTWLDLDFEYVRVCDYFFYMTPDVYGESKGAAREIEYAKKLGKVIYYNINEVPNIKRDSHAVY